MRPLEANDNLPTPAWFNIPSFLKSANVEKVDEQGMIDSVNAGTYIDHRCLYWFTDKGIMTCNSQRIDRERSE